MHVYTRKGYEESASCLYTYDKHTETFINLCGRPTSALGGHRVSSPCSVTRTFANITKPESAFVYLGDINWAAYINCMCDELGHGYTASMEVVDEIVC